MKIKKKYVHHSIIDADFVSLIDLFIDDDNIGINTRCELLSELIFFTSYQKNRMRNFLCKNIKQLIEIMHNRINEDYFNDIKLAYKSIPNINNINKELSKNDEKINLEDIYVKLIVKKFPTYSNDFKKDAQLLLYEEIDENIDIKKMIEKFYQIDPNLVAIIISRYLNYNENKYKDLVRLYFNLLKKATLISAIINMIDYLASELTEVSEKDQDILKYLIDSISGIESEGTLKNLQFVLKKWRTILSIKDFKDAFIASIKQIYKLKEVKVKTDVNEFKKTDELNNKLMILKKSRKYEIMGAGLLEYVSLDALDKLLEQFNADELEKLSKYFNPEKLSEFFNLEKLHEFFNPEELLEFLNIEKLLEHFNPEELLECSSNPEKFVEFFTADELSEMLPKMMSKICDNLVSKNSMDNECNDIGETLYEKL
jgi:hypothetical protein